MIKKRAESRILIIHPEGNSFNNPTLKCLIDLLVDQGISVDLRYGASDAHMPTQYKGVKFLPYGKLYRFFWAVVLEIICFAPLIWLIVYLENLFVYGDYQIVIGVDREGLIQASMLHRINKTPYIFISFEIMFMDETSRRFKTPEIKASEYASAWLVQDDVRANILLNENKLEPDRKILLPLASVGYAETSLPRLRDQLGIPNDKKVAITIGSITQWTMALDIVKSAVSWPDDWVLIVHDRYGKTSEHLGEILNFIKPYINNKIYISNETTQMVDELGSILAGVSVGLAFYKPTYDSPTTGKNLKYLGLASGKISTYLRYGIPIIVNDIGLFSDAAQKHHFGHVVKDADQIRMKLNEIDQTKYRENAKKYFKEFLDFKLYEEKILNCIKNNMLL